MFNRFSNFLKNTKDKRLKFNFHMGSFIIINIVTLSIMYIYSKILYDIFGMEWFYRFLFTYYTFFISIPISAIFSFKSYYWYYQKDLMNNLFSNESIKNISLNSKDRFDFILLIIYKIFPYFLISSFLLVTLLNKKILDNIDLSMVLFANCIFIIYLIKSLSMKFNYEIFKKIKYEGLMTNYSKGHENE